MQLKWAAFGLGVAAAAWAAGDVFFGPEAEATAITPAQLEAALAGVRPALEGVRARPRVTPAKCRGDDPLRSDAQLDAWRDAGAVDFPLTVHGCLRERHTRGPGFTRREVFVFGKGGALRRDAVEQREGLVLAARDTNEDGVFDEETVWRYSDAGAVASAVTLVYPTDGGRALSQHRSTALGGNARHIEVLRWLDGGWVQTESFDSHWRDEGHFGR